MTDHLGEPWDIIDPGIKLKKYPCCGSIHPALDAMLRLLDKTNLTVNEVEELICSVHPSKQHILVNPRPRTGLAAKFSVEYCIARALADGRISIAHFQDAKRARRLGYGISTARYGVAGPGIAGMGQPDYRKNKGMAES